MPSPAANSNEQERDNPSAFTDEQAQATQEALVRRPRISIRLRIAVGFLAAFILNSALIIAAMLFISHISKQQQFLERAGNFEFEIQQARRFEKNYFLYGTNLYDALNNAQNAQNLLHDFENEMRQVIGNHAYDSMTYNLGSYVQSLEKLRALNESDKEEAAKIRLSVESELRNFGAAIVVNASNAIDQERLRVQTWLRSSWVVALSALVFTLLLEIFIVTFIAQQIIRPFSRFEKYTERIAAGDFSLITPRRRYRDEFTNLAIALNRMLAELKKREDQLIQSRKLAAVGNLTAGIAHELNNPLNNISLTTEALIDEFDEWDKATKLKMLQDIFSQVERAGTTVANLLDFTRRDKEAFEQVHLKDVLERTLKLMANEINLSQVQLDVDLDDNLPPIMGNQNNLQQVFLNLFLNALQAMPDGGTLCVKAFAEHESLKVVVNDTGIGIPKENLNSIFDPFFTTKELGKGTGLGLSVSYGIIQKHQGTITVESEVGKGTSFTITLPCVGSVKVSTSF
jgi:two-component system NtrC family sensor kinase